MSQSVASPMPEELRAVVRRYRKAFITVALLSAVLNVLVLGGSIYMMMVYDSVLPSHSLPTLFGLLALLVGVYAFQGVFENFRSGLLSDVGNSLDRTLARRVQRAMTDVALYRGSPAGDGLSPMRDLESVRAWFAGPGPATLIDLPWILFFIGILMLLHFWTGFTALVGGAILVCLTIAINRMVKGPSETASRTSADRYAIAEVGVRHAEVLSALGMRGRLLDRLQQVNTDYLAAQRNMNRSVATLGAMSRIGRMLLQSLILTVGAILVIKGQASGGAIFASSILAGRALAPVDQAIANWKSMIAARAGWQRLSELLAKVPPEPATTNILPRPAVALQVQNLFVAPPGTQQLTVQAADFTLNAGDGLAIIGPSAAGKSSLARALVGVWRPVRGAIRLDGAALDQYPEEVLGRYLGYLPQTVELFEGSVADNIARFDPERTPEDVIHAARAAGVHDMIVGLPNGYETQVGMNGRNLSGGQQQRIGLARALYKDPFFVLLDEPNSNLDSEGDAALERAIAGIRARGGIVIIIAHRPSALANANLVLMMRDGRIEMLGPRVEVLQRLVAMQAPQPQPAPASTPATAARNVA
ncbi:type I secretion system permease/ATPase [Sphingobium olei]|uniref:Type I secretion system permease/ATPase n=1 Tax=Sphingobium olei TaxID=420955 RepID=A0ABW3P6E9_9SPHN